MKEKIVIVGPCLKMGGIERASSLIANFANGQGHPVLYLAIFQQARFFSLSPTIQYDEPTDGSNRAKLSIVKTLFRIRRKIEEFDPDTVLVFNKFYASLTLIALFGLGVKVFISERSSPLYRWPAKLAWINRLALLLNPPVGVIAQTEIAASYQRKVYGKKMPVRVIPNALRLVTLYPGIERKKWILAVGRFGDPLKGFDRLVKAFSKIKAADWRLVFAGGDEDGEEIKTLAKELGVFERISFFGKVDDLDRVYAEAGIFVIPSRSEGFPNALCEAMAAGLPCVAFDFIAGPRDMITADYDGLIVRENDVEALADAIDSLILDDDKRAFLSANALKIRNRLELSKIGNEFCDFILSKK